MAKTEIDAKKQEEFLKWMKQHIVDIYGETPVFTLVVLTDPNSDDELLHYCSNILQEDTPNFLAMAAASANNAR